VLEKHPSTCSMTRAPRKRSKNSHDASSDDESYSDHQLNFYDFTLKSEGTDRDAFHAFLEGICKKYVYQLEAGELSGYEHYQGRISLHKKKRVGEVITQYKWPGIHWSPTSTQGTKTFSYVMKQDTRIAGPWSDTDPKPMRVARQVTDFRQKPMYPWQASVVELCKQWNSRNIICIYDDKGCNGKTSLRLHLMTAGLARSIPFCNDYRDVMRMVMCMPRNGCYFIDLPRALGKDKLYQMWSACESIKDGYIYEDRYSFRDEIIDSPQLIITTNCVPNTDLLTRDRWDIYTINDQKELIKYTPVYKERYGETQVQTQHGGEQAAQAGGQEEVRVEA